MSKRKNEPTMLVSKHDRIMSDVREYYHEETSDLRVSRVVVAVFSSILAGMIAFAVGQHSPETVGYRYVRVRDKQELQFDSMNFYDAGVFDPKTGACLVKAYDQKTHKIVEVSALECDDPELPGYYVRYRALLNRALKTEAMRGTPRN